MKIRRHASVSPEIQPGDFVWVNTPNGRSSFFGWAVDRGALYWLVEEKLSDGATSTSRWPHAFLWRAVWTWHGPLAL